MFLSPIKLVTTSGEQYAYIHCRRDIRLQWRREILKACQKVSPSSVFSYIHRERDYPFTAHNAQYCLFRSNNQILFENIYNKNTVTNPESLLYCQYDIGVYLFMIADKRSLRKKKGKWNVKYSIYFF